MTGHRISVARYAKVPHGPDNPMPRTSFPGKDSVFKRAWLRIKIRVEEQNEPTRQSPFSEAGSLVSARVAAVERAPGPPTSIRPTARLFRKTTGVTVSRPSHRLRFRLG
jgi:hypothetical protein